MPTPHYGNPTSGYIFRFSLRFSFCLSFTLKCSNDPRSTINFCRFRVLEMGLTLHHKQDTVTRLASSTRYLDHVTAGTADHTY